VILLALQAMLGFQLIVVMTESFERLPHLYQRLHSGAGQNWRRQS